MSTRAHIAAEECISSVEPFNNGAGPIWCFGSSTLVRDGNALYCTIPEVGAGVTPLCNTRWNLYRRLDGQAWERVYQSPNYDQREPCPMVRLPGGRVAVSTNPAYREWYAWADGRKRYCCTPQLAFFDLAHLERGPEMHTPVWSMDHAFNEHSYRGMGVDAETGALFLAHQAPDPDQDHDFVVAWSYLDAEGSWSQQGVLRFPMRGCYPQIAVRGRAVYILAISDEMEPVPAWADYKAMVTGQRDWDYDFRQLFFTWTPDITKRPFSPPLTVASRDETAGIITNRDLWIAPDGDAYVLYQERNIWHAFMRDRFWPGTPTKMSLKMARVHNGRVAERWLLQESVENMTDRATVSGKAERYEPTMTPPVPSYAVFHATPDGRLYVVCHQSGTVAAGNYIRQVLPDLGEPIPIPLSTPLASFFTASVRAGSLPAESVDLYGMPASGAQEIRHAQFTLSN